MCLLYGCPLLYSPPRGAALLTDPQSYQLKYSWVGKQEHGSNLTIHLHVCSSVPTLCTAWRCLSLAANETRQRCITSTVLQALKLTGGHCWSSCFTTGLLLPCFWEITPLSAKAPSSLTHPSLAGNWSVWSQLCPHDCIPSPRHSTSPSFCSAHLWILQFQASQLKYGYAVFVHHLPPAVPCGIWCCGEEFLKPSRCGPDGKLHVYRWPLTEKGPMS